MSEMIYFLSLNHFQQELQFVYYQYQLFQFLQVTLSDNLMSIFGSVSLGTSLSAGTFAISGSSPVLSPEVLLDGTSLFFFRADFVSGLKDKGGLGGFFPHVIFLELDSGGFQTPAPEFSWESISLGAWEVAFNGWTW